MKSHYIWNMKNNGLSVFRLFLLIIGISSIFRAYTFGEKEINYNSQLSYVVADAGINGGACGFAILSGLCFVAIAITYLRKDS